MGFAMELETTADTSYLKSYHVSTLNSYHRGGTFNADIEIPLIAG